MLSTWTVSTLSIRWNEEWNGVVFRQIQHPVYRYLLYYMCFLTHILSALLKIKPRQQRSYLIGILGFNGRSINTYTIQNVHYPEHAHHDNLPVRLPTRSHPPPPPQPSSPSSAVARPVPLPLHHPEFHAPLPAS